MSHDQGRFGGIQKVGCLETPSLGHRDVLSSAILLGCDNVHIAAFARLQHRAGRGGGVGILWGLSLFTEENSLSIGGEHDITENVIQV